MEKLIYKIVDQNEWNAATSAGRYTGSADDLRDGFIHFSTAGQLVGTAAKHFAERENLILVGVETESLGDLLKWEASRDDQLFPHLYGSFAVDQACLVEPLPLGDDGLHKFPASLNLV